MLERFDAARIAALIDGVEHNVINDTAQEIVFVEIEIR